MKNDIIEFLKERISYAEANQWAAYHKGDPILEKIFYGHLSAYRDVKVFVENVLMNKLQNRNYYGSLGEEKPHHPQNHANF